MSDDLTPPSGYRRVYGMGIGHCGANNRLGVSIIEKQLSMYKDFEERHGLGSVQSQAGLTKQTVMKACENEAKNIINTDIGIMPKEGVAA